LAKKISKKLSALRFLFGGLQRVLVLLDKRAKLGKGSSAPKIDVVVSQILLARVGTHGIDGSGLAFG
jgi:hypothetical protein